MENAAPESASGAAIANKPKNLHGRETILLAENHDCIRESIRQSLTRLGYQVLAAADGPQALRLAVLDVVMPHMGGAATAAQLLRQTLSAEAYGPTSLELMDRIDSPASPLQNRIIVVF
jgi:CheY-like chemotaxis protein